MHNKLRTNSILFTQTRPYLDKIGNSSLLPVLFTLALFVVAGPLHLRKPLTTDSILWDLQTRWMNEGQGLYKETIEVNFPGAFYVHQISRSILGQSNESLRIFDLVLIGILVAALSRFIYLASENRNLALWFPFLGFAFYFSIPEWGHCQRDLWALTFASLACHFRLQAITAHAVRKSFPVLAGGFIEGILWGCSMLIKPHIFMVALSVYLVTFRINLVQRKLWLESIGLLFGGVLIFASCMAHLSWNHSLVPFFDTLAVWMPRYASGRSWSLENLLLLNASLFPWAILHLIAIPYAIKILIHNQPRDDDDANRRIPLKVCSAAYLGWVLQAFFIQKSFPYIFVPLVFLAIAIVLPLIKRLPLAWSRFSIVMLTLIAGLSQVHYPTRLDLWPKAITDQLDAHDLDLLTSGDTSWAELEEVSDFLAERNVQHKDVLLCSADSIYLYWTLKLESPTPYVYFDQFRYLIAPSLSDSITEQAYSSGAKYAVNDLSFFAPNLDAATLAFNPTEPFPIGLENAKLSAFPWKEKLVFRSGRYMVYEISR